MRAKILIWFDQTKRAFDRNDRELAKSTREEAFLHEKECDRLVWELAVDNGGRNAVAVAIIIRFFKRVAAHLGNICTSVVMPIDKLDYFDESA
jgi:phosphate uptake regulator